MLFFLVLICIILLEMRDYMLTISLDKNKCIGCGACVAIAPNNFEFDDDGLSNVIDQEASEEAIEASEVCPVMAIEILKDDNHEKTHDCKNNKDHNNCCCKHDQKEKGDKVEKHCCNQDENNEEGQCECNKDCSCCK